MVHDIKTVSRLNDLSKFADDIVIIAPAHECEASIDDENGKYNNMVQPK